MRLLYLSNGKILAAWRITMQNLQKNSVNLSRTKFALEPVLDHDFGLPFHIGRETCFAFLNGEQKTELRKAPREKWFNLALRYDPAIKAEIQHKTGTRHFAVVAIVPL